MHKVDAVGVLGLVGSSNHVLSCDEPKRIQCCFAAVAVEVLGDESRER